MACRVLVVDDSGFFRRRIAEILNADAGIEVVGAAADGKEAIKLAKELKPDVVTMDIEMPVMDGITAVRHIMAEAPCPVLMFSTLTTDGAQATLDALDAGAVDFLPKRFNEMAGDEEAAKALLRRRVRTLARGRARAAAASAATVTAPASARAHGAPSAPPSASGSRPSESLSKAADIDPVKLKGARAVLIGTSTGGPVALQEVLRHLPKSFPLPIALVQHMPASFTPAFAERLNKLCQIEVREAVNGDTLRPGVALLAPGGMQMLLEGGSATRIKIADSEPGTIYKPSVDICFQSAVGALRGQVLAVVLTGMGADGREGVRVLKGLGAKIWAQDAASCVVYGMPAAVAEAGLADDILALKEVGPALVKGFCR